MKRRLIALSIAGAALVSIGALLRTSRTREPRNPNASVPYGRGSRIEEILTIAREPLEVYAAWRSLESLPLAIPHVVPTGGSRTTWRADIFEDVPGQRIAWRTDNAPIQHAGSVRFNPAPGGRGTEVHVEIEYVSPAGRLGAFALKLARKSPLRRPEFDLRRIKATLEAGDVAVNGTDVTA